MKKLSYIIASIFISAMLWGGILSAQDQDSGTYIDNASPQDSSYTDSDSLTFDEFTEEQGSGNLGLYIGAAIIVVGAIVVIALRKKKKK